MLIRVSKYRLCYRLKGKLATLFIKLISPLVSVFESALYRLKKGRSEQVNSPVFIIGAPRTGSTILYQALTNGYDVQYIDNFASAWYRNILFGMWLSHRRYKKKPHNNFTANHGSTTGYGGHAPSECGAFWYRWLPKDRHFVDHKDVTSCMVDELRNEVLMVQEVFGEPMLFKNLNAGQRLRLISKAFPDAKIIFLRRDPRFVVRSILKARAKLGIGSNRWWSIMPPNVDALMDLPEGEMCAAQVYFLEKQIANDLVLFPSSNIRIVHYKDLSQSLLQDLAKWIGVSPKPKSVEPIFKQDCFAKLSQEEKIYLDNLVNCYPFEKDLFA